MERNNSFDFFKHQHEEAQRVLAELKEKEKQKTMFTAKLSNGTLVQATSKERLEKIIQTFEKKLSKY